MRARADELRADGQGIGETRTRRGQVKAPRFSCTNALLHQASCRGKKHVRGNAGEHNQVDFRGIRLGLCQQALCGLRGHMRSDHAILGDVAFPDAGTRTDPFVVGFDDPLQIRIGHHLGWNVAGYTRNFCREAVGHDAPCELRPGQRR